MKFMGRTDFIGSKFFAVRFAHTKNYSLYLLYFPFCFFQITKKSIRKFLMSAKRMMITFDQIKAVLSMKFVCLGCTMVTLRSEKLLYMNTTEPNGSQWFSSFSGRTVTFDNGRSKHVNFGRTVISSLDRIINLVIVSNDRIESCAG